MCGWTIVRWPSRPATTRAEWLHVHSDHLGTPRAVTRPQQSNATIWRWSLTSSSFGESAPEQDPDGDSSDFVFDLRYPGQYFDQESGLHYNYFRDYEAGTGRYVQSDPIGLKGGVNTYAYANERPLYDSDYFGLAVWRGGMYQVGGAFFVGGGVAIFELQAKCQNGKRATARVLYVGPMLGWGGTYASASSVTFEDHNYQPNPDAFNGVAGLLSAGLTPGFGPSCGLYVLGIAEMKASNAEAAGCGIDMGLNIGIGLTIGTSTVISGSEEKCCDDGK